MVVIQNWGKIERVFNPSQVVSEQTRASARVVLYSTEWCGYCKQIRRFLDQKGIPYRAFDDQGASGFVIFDLVAQQVRFKTAHLGLAQSGA